MDEPEDLKASAANAAKLASAARTNWRSLRQLHTKAQRYCLHGEYKEAEKLATRLVKKTAEAAGVDDTDLSVSLTVLMGEMAAGLIGSMRALALNALASAYCLLGETYRGQGKQSEAEAAFRQARAIRSPDKPLHCPLCYFSTDLCFTRTDSGGLLECTGGCGFRLPLGPDWEAKP